MTNKDLLKRQRELLNKIEALSLKLEKTESCIKGIKRILEIDTIL
ncbi:hypothetical protein [Clostridium sp.]